VVKQAEIMRLRSMLVGFATEKDSLLKKIARLTKENEELRHKCSSAQIAESTRVLYVLSDNINR
jgi:predicted RNase H-like nuclease (RuvC/YqgF family)